MTYSIKKVDKNQPEIVGALKKAGMSVLHLHTLGNGAPDILVGYHGKNFLFEIKSHGGKLTKDEQVFYFEWQGQTAMIFNAEQAIRYVESHCD